MAEANEPMIGSHKVTAPYGDVVSDGLPSDHELFVARGPIAYPGPKVNEAHANDSRVNHPRHYNEHPSGVECITVVEHMNFNLGNAMKYIWRADEKGYAIEDLMKAAWYVKREIKRRKKMK